MSPLRIAFLSAAASLVAVAALATTHTVNVQDNSFSPHDLTICLGDTVTWKNNDGTTHTASKTGGPGPNFDTGNISSGGTSAPVAFNTAGAMSYRCNIHNNMTGTIQVNA